MLTAEEQTLVRDTFARGPTALIEAGYDEEAIKGFFARLDVMDYWSLLDQELDHADALEVRQRYMARRGLNRLSGAAVAVIGRAMAGPRYLYLDDKDEKGNPKTDSRGNPQRRVAVNNSGIPIVREPEITPVQLRASMATLDYLGIQPGRVRPVTDADVDIKILYEGDRPKITLDEDPSHEREAEKALARERVRNVISVIAPEIPQLAAKLDESLGLAAPKKAPRKKAKKKVAKKKAKKRVRKRS